MWTGETMWKSLKKLGGVIVAPLKATVTVLEATVEIIKEPRKTREILQEKTKDLQHALVDPIVETARGVTNAISEATAPINDYITEKVAPVAKKMVEVTVNIATAPYEITAKSMGHIAGALGDKETHATLNKHAGDVHRSAESIAEASGQIVTAKNTAQIAAGVAGTIACGPGCAGLAVSAMQAAQGETVTGTDIIVNSVASLAGNAAGGGIANPILSGAAEGATRETTKTVVDKAVHSEKMTFNDVRDSAIRGGVVGAVSGGLKQTATHSTANIATNALKDGATSAVRNAVEQYQETEKIDIGSAIVAGSKGAMQSAFSATVSATVKQKLAQLQKTAESSQASQETNEADETFAPDDISEDAIDTEPALDLDAELTDPKKLLQEMPTLDQQAFEENDTIGGTQNDLDTKHLPEGETVKDMIEDKAKSKVLDDLAKKTERSIEKQYKITQKSVERDAAKLAKKEIKAEAKRTGQALSRKQIETVRSEAKKAAAAAHNQQMKKVKLAAGKIIRNADNIHSLATADDKLQAAKNIVTDQVEEKLLETAAKVAGNVLTKAGMAEVGAWVTRMGSITLSVLLHSPDCCEGDTLPNPKTSPQSSTGPVHCDEHNQCYDTQGNRVYANSASRVSSGWIDLVKGVQDALPVMQAVVPLIAKQFGLFGYAPLKASEFQKQKHHARSQIRELRASLTELRSHPVAKTKEFAIAEAAITKARAEFIISFDQPDQHATHSDSNMLTRKCDAAIAALHTVTDLHMKCDEKVPRIEEKTATKNEQSSGMTTTLDLRLFGTESVLRQKNLSAPLLFLLR